MIIQCSQCGAPLDIKDGAKLVKCAYCKGTNRVASSRTVAPVTPADWRPPPAWQAPPHVQGGTVLSYHKPWSTMAGLSAILTLGTVVIVGGAAAWFSARTAGAPYPGDNRSAQVAAAESAIRQAQANAREAAEEARRAAERAIGNTTSVNYFGQGGPEQALASFKSALHTTRITANEIVLYPTYAILEARDPANSKHVDRYAVRGGVVGAPDPISNSSLPSDIEKRWFDPDSVALSKIPSLLERTVQKLNYEQGKTSHVIIESNLPFSKDLVIRVYVSGPRDSGRIDYRADGSELRVYR